MADETKSAQRVDVKGATLVGISKEKIDELLRTFGELYFLPLVDGEGEPEGTVIFRTGRREDVKRYRASVAKGSNFTDEAEVLFATVCVYPSPSDQGSFATFLDRYSGIPVRVANELLKLSNGEALSFAKKVRTISSGP